jgi:NDP-sugar pyrophosphorylase family protein
LAGGKGTRIAHLHPDLPKPALPVAGRPFLSWILHQLASSGFSSAVIASGYQATELRREIEAFVPTKMKMSITCYPVVSRNQVSNEFSLRDYATGALVKGGFW